MLVIHNVDPDAAHTCICYCFIPSLPIVSAYFLASPIGFFVLPGGHFAEIGKFSYVYSSLSIWFPDIIDLIIKYFTIQK